MLAFIVVATLVVCLCTTIYAGVRAYKLFRLRADYRARLNGLAPSARTLEYGVVRPETIQLIAVPTVVSGFPDTAQFVELTPTEQALYSSTLRDRVSNKRMLRSTVTLVSTVVLSAAFLPMAGRYLDAWNDLRDDQNWSLDVFMVFAGVPLVLAVLVLVPLFAAGFERRSRNRAERLLTEYSKLALASLPEPER